MNTTCYCLAAESNISHYDEFFKFLTEQTVWSGNFPVCRGHWRSFDQFPTLMFWRMLRLLLEGCSFTRASVNVYNGRGSDREMTKLQMSYIFMKGSAVYDLSVISIFEHSDKLSESLFCTFYQLFADFIKEYYLFSL